MGKHVDFEGSKIEPNRENIKNENRMGNISSFLLFVNLFVSVILFFTGMGKLDSYNGKEEALIYIAISLIMGLSSFLFYYFIAVIAEISINLKRRKQ